MRVPGVLCCVLPVILAGSQKYRQPKNNYIPHKPLYYNPQSYHNSHNHLGPYIQPQPHFRAVHNSYYQAPSHNYHSFDYGRNHANVRNYEPSTNVLGSLSGISPMTLNTIFAHLGLNNLEHVHRIPAVAKHIFGEPERVIVRDHPGPPQKLHGTIQTFHTVKTIDHGGQILKGTPQKGHQNSLPPGDFSDYTGYEDFEFPPDW